MAVVPQPAFSFVSGEVSPSFFGRTDLVKYSVGAKLLYNMYVDYRGGAVSRPGSRFIGPIPQGEAGQKLVKFRATNDDYLLIFTHEKLRFLRSGGYLLNTGKTITGISAGVVTATAHGFSAGDLVYLSGIAGMTELNQRYFTVGTVATNTFEILAPDGTVLDTSGYTAYSSGGTAAKTVTIATPYGYADLDKLRVEQRYATLILTSADFAPRRLTYVSDTSWTLATITFGSSVSAPTGVTLTESATGSAGTAVVVTAIDSNGNESVASSYAIETTMVDYSDTAGHLKITWTDVAGAESYNVYRSLILPVGTDVTTDQATGFIGFALGNSFVDTNITPDFTKTPPGNFNPFASSNHPSLFKVFQQRGVYAGSEEFPMSIWGSRPGDLDNFDLSYILNDGDSYLFTLDTSDVQPIKHMLSIRTGLLLFTSVGVTLLRAEEGKAISPLNAVAEPQAFRGAADAPPIPIDLDVVFLQAQSTAVNSMMYTEYTNTFQLQDISVLSSHLIGLTRRITRMEWMAEPNKLIYGLREDGRLLTITYERNLEVFGWAQQATQGKYLDICEVIEDDSNTLYTVVSRRLGGVWQRFIEVQEKREKELAEDFWCVDSGLSYPLTTPAAELNFSAADGTGITCTADASVFSAGNVGDIIYAGKGKLEITGYTSGTVVTCKALRPIALTIPENDTLPFPVASGAWSLGTPTATVSNLWHLEGETVSVLADGDAFVDLTVTDGAITLPYAATKITIGLPYRCRLETLPMHVDQAVTAHRRKQILGVATRMRATRGLSVGASFDYLVEMKESGTEDWGEELALRDEVVYTPLNSTWDRDVTTCFQQSYPLPATILSCIYALDVGDD